MKKKTRPKKRQESVFKEAWGNMSSDFDRLMPEKLRQKQGKKKFVFWLFLIELLVFGGVGVIIYRWWFG